MAHFAQLDENNNVINVIVVNNEVINDLSFPESEPIGVEFCQSLYGADTIWKQTSYNANFRYNYAGIGYTYDSQRDAFIPFKSYESWILDESTCRWVPPVPYPDDGKEYVWNEDEKNWREFT